MPCVAAVSLTDADETVAAPSSGTHGSPGKPSPKKLVGGGGNGRRYRRRPSYQEGLGDYLSDESPDDEVDRASSRSSSSSDGRSRGGERSSSTENDDVRVEHPKCKLDHVDSSNKHAIVPARRRYSVSRKRNQATACAYKPALPVGRSEMPVKDLSPNLRRDETLRQDRGRKEGRHPHRNSSLTRSRYHRRPSGDRITRRSISSSCQTV